MTTGLLSPYVYSSDMGYLFDLFETAYTECVPVDVSTTLSIAGSSAVSVVLSGTLRHSICCTGYFAESSI